MKAAKKIVGGARTTVLGLVAVAAALVLGVYLKMSLNSERSFSVVPNYDLLVRDVQAGAPAVRVPDMDALPEDEYTYMVSYDGLLFGGDGQGYMIQTTDAVAAEKYEVSCCPVSGYSFAVEPNAEYAGVPVEVDLDDTGEDGLWVGQLYFDLDGYRYWVRYENWNGEVQDVLPRLEEITLSILE